jgi:hypothetical protein
MNNVERGPGKIWTENFDFGGLHILIAVLSGKECVLSSDWTNYSRVSPFRCDAFALKTWYALPCSIVRVTVVNKILLFNRIFHTFHNYIIFYHRSYQMDQSLILIFNNIFKRMNFTISRFWRVLTMVYNTHNYWVFFWTFPSSGILETRKHDVSETGPVSSDWD